jgi:hypothetical protein
VDCPRRKDEHVHRKDPEKRIHVQYSSEEESQYAGDPDREQLRLAE